MIREDEDAVRALRGALATAVRGHHLDPAVAEPAVARLEADPPRRGSAREYLAVAAACVVVAGTATGIYAATSSRSHPGTAAAPPPGSACDGAVVTGPLPEWARAGFSDPNPTMPHVMSASGQVVAILFANPLRAPARPDPNNKILWVTHDGSGGSLTIRARLEGSNRTAVQSVPDGPGPSIIDMPVAGCWQMTLTWPGHTDTIAIPYAP